MDRTGRAEPDAATPIASSGGVGVAPSAGDTIASSSILRIGAALLLLMALLYGLTAPGHLQTTDNRAELAVAQSIVSHLDFTVSDLSPVPIPWTMGSDGKKYSKYGIGASVLLVPAALIGNLVDCDRTQLDCSTTIQRLDEFVASFLDPLSAAISVFVLFAFALDLGARARHALALALLFGFSTIEWAYAHDAFDVAPTGFFLLLALFALHRGMQSPRTRWLLISGVAMAFAILMRLPSAICAPVFMAYLLAPTGRQPARAVVTRTITWTAPILISLLVIGWYNASRFGSPFESGYGIPQSWLVVPTLDISTKYTGEGLKGLLISPGKSIFLFSPGLVIAVAGLPVFLKRHLALGLTLGAVVALNLVFYASGRDWSGDLAWGPRYMVPVTGLAMLPAIRVVERWSGLGRPWRIGLVATAAAGAAIQLLDVMVDYVQQGNLLAQQGITLESTYWHAPNSAIARHAFAVWAHFTGTAPNVSQLSFSETLAGRPSPIPDVWWLSIWANGLSPLFILPVLGVMVCAICFLGWRIGTWTRPMDLGGPG